MTLHANQPLTLLAPPLLPLLTTQGALTAAPTSVDGKYYTEVVQQTGRRGWFQSDVTRAKGLQTVRYREPEGLGLGLGLGAPPPLALHPPLHPLDKCSKATTASLSSQSASRPHTRPSHPPSVVKVLDASRPHTRPPHPPSHLAPPAAALEPQMGLIESPTTPPHCRPP